MYTNSTGTWRQVTLKENSWAHKRKQTRNRSHFRLALMTGLFFFFKHILIYIYATKMEYSNTVVDVWFIERERQLNTQKLQTTLSTFKCTWADQPLAKTLLLLMFNHHPDKTFPLHKRMNTSSESYCLPFHFGSPACFFVHI